MGLISHRVTRSEIKAGDHIYTYRALYSYSHHGIFVGCGKVVHFTPGMNSEIISSSSCICSSSMQANLCPNNMSDCGFNNPKSGVVLSCLDCFLGYGSLYSYQYGVSSFAFFVKVRGGTCTTAKSDPPEEVIDRAMKLLKIGFGSFSVTSNNCEDFALYCKTGLLVTGKVGAGSSGQKCSVVGVLKQALEWYRLNWAMTPLGVATYTVGMYHMKRYKGDLGVRTDAIKVAVDDLQASLGYVEGSGEENAGQPNAVEIVNALQTFLLMIQN